MTDKLKQTARDLQAELARDPEIAEAKYTKCREWVIAHLAAARTKIGPLDLPGERSERSLAREEYDAKVLLALVEIVKPLARTKAKSPEARPGGSLADEDAGGASPTAPGSGRSGSMNLRTMQRELPAWGVELGKGGPPAPNVECFEHAVTHAMKALGRLAGMVDDADHARARAGGVRLPDEYPEDPSDVSKFAADLVVCAIKMAQTYPGGSFNLEAAVVERVRAKNPPGTFPSADPEYRP